MEGVGMALGGSLVRRAVLRVVGSEVAGTEVEDSAEQTVEGGLEEDCPGFQLGQAAAEDSAPVW